MKKTTRRSERSGQVANHRRTRRLQAGFEPMETRCLLAAGITVLTGLPAGLDVTGDGFLSPLDALYGVNFNQEHGGNVVVIDPMGEHAHQDVNGDGYFDRRDIQDVVDALNERGAGPLADIYRDEASRATWGSQDLPFAAGPSSGRGETRSLTYPRPPRCLGNRPGSARAGTSAW